LIARGADLPGEGRGVEDDALGDLPAQPDRLEHVVGALVDRLGAARRQEGEPGIVDRQRRVGLDVDHRVTVGVLAPGHDDIPPPDGAHLDAVGPLDRAQVGNGGQRGQVTCLVEHRSSFRDKGSFIARPEAASGLQAARRGVRVKPSLSRGTDSPEVTTGGRFREETSTTGQLRVGVSGAADRASDRSCGATGRIGDQWSLPRPGISRCGQR